MPWLANAIELLDDEALGRSLPFEFLRPAGARQ
jgi:hypothetical protein